MAVRVQVRIGFVVGLLMLVVAAPAVAGTYDVVTCSPSGPGGVNNAWTYAVHRIDGQPATQDDRAGYEDVARTSCAGPVGLSIRSNAALGDKLASWGIIAVWEFKAPRDSQVVGLNLWRYSKVWRTDTGNREGRYQVLARAGGADLGGVLGPDQCIPGFAGMLDPCVRGARGFGANARSSYELVAPDVSLGIFCGTDAGTIQACHTAARDGSGPAGEFAMQAAIVTVRDVVAPKLEVGGPLLAGGWQRGDNEVAWSASDNTGIRRVRVLLDGQERNRVELNCDYTYARPCSDAPNRTIGLGSAPLPDGRHELQVVAEDAAGNITTVTRSISLDAHGPTATLARASGKTITVRVNDGASGVAGGTIEVRNRRSEPFRALPTKLRDGRLTAKLDRGSASRVGIRVAVPDNAGNVTAGQLSEMSVRISGRKLRGGSAYVRYGRSARLSGSLRTRDGVPLAGQPITVEQTLRTPGSTPAAVATVTTDSHGRFSYGAPAGVSRRLRFVFGGAADLAPLTRTAQMRVRAGGTIHASPRALRGSGRVRFSGRLGLRGATVPQSGKIVELQAYERGRWRTFATARARGSKGAWRASYRFGGTPGRYPVRLRIRREAVFPYDLGYSRSVVVRVR